MDKPSIADAERELVEEFALFDNWMDRYQHIIDLGRQLPAFPETEKTEKTEKTEERKVRGCQSQVWLVTTPKGDRLEFQAGGDGGIADGLIAILMRIYSGRPTREIRAIPPGFIMAIGLDQHLSREPGEDAGLEALQGHSISYRIAVGPAPRANQATPGHGGRLLLARRGGGQSPRPRHTGTAVPLHHPAGAGHRPRVCWR